jgi:hypothetical protein
MISSKYIRITNIEANGSFVQKASEINQSIDGELDDLSEPVTLRFEAVEMTDEEYEALPDFPGY